LKGIKAIKVSLKGINAVAGGLIAVAAIILMQKSGFTFENMSITLLTIVLLKTKKFPTPLIVALILGLGFVM
jgi:chromate transporter